MDDSKFLIIGAGGQLGLALKERFANARFVDRHELDITDEAQVHNFDWSGIEVIFNVAAYTDVDMAETAEGRVTAWKVNAVAASLLSNIATKHDITLVHISTDYVFDGASESPHTEEEAFSPLSVYGASKAAGDIAVTLTPKHYILRTSWVIGEGKNFVRTMLSLVDKGINPSVVADQTGRLTFTSELVHAINHLLSQNAQYGTYNVSNEGASVSWAQITRKIFELAHAPNTVTDTTTAAYFADKEGIAPRPFNSSLSLKKLHTTGFISTDWEVDLKKYIEKELSR